MGIKWERSTCTVFPLSSPPQPFHCSHLISFEALRQDPVVDVAWDTGERAVDSLRGAPLGDAFRDCPSVGTVGKGEELPVVPSVHLGRKNTCQNRILTEIYFSNIFNI